MPVTLGLAIAAIYLMLFNRINPSELLVKDYIAPTKISFSTAVKKATSSVVTIYTQRFSTNSKKKPNQSNLGSGVIITNNGLLITNYHVIDGADNILVHLSDGRSATAMVIGQDRETDIAVLKIPFRNLTEMEIQTQNKIDVGDIVLAIGNPLNIGQTVTMGIISATGRNRVGINTYENFIQTDASINPGNSGGALIDIEGKIIGINTAIFSQSGGSSGIGFAIPIQLALDIMQELIENGYISRGWFGVAGVQPTTENDNPGVLITEVFDKSPAEHAGIKAGDLLTQINNRDIRKIRDVVDQVATLRPGSYVLVTVIREQKEQQFKLLITERPIE